MRAAAAAAGLTLSSWLVRAARQAVLREAARAAGKIIKITPDDDDEDDAEWNTDMNNVAQKFTIEGLADGTWCREHVGANESNLFDSREAAEAELDGLARALECDVSSLRVVEVAS